jgi:hypothetical protein
MLQGGRNNEHLRPLRPDGTVVENVRGTHRGNAEDLNVANALPGFLYYWCRSTQSDLMRFLRAGWQVVPPDSPERAFRRDPDYRSLGLDGIQTNKDVVLIRIPEAMYRRLAEHQVRINRTALEGPTQDYLGKSNKYDRWSGQAEGPILYQGRNHAAVA